MSKEILRAYEKFKKMEEKRNAKAQTKMIASGAKGLLAPRSSRSPKMENNNDPFEFLYSVASEIRKYGGKENG